MNDKEILEKMNKDENYRSDVLINFNFEMQLAQRICYVHENKFSPQEYKLAVVSLEQENARLKDKVERSFKIVDDKLTNLNLEYGVNYKFRAEYDELWEILKEN